MGNTNITPPEEMDYDEEVVVCKAMNTLTFKDSLKVIKGRLGDEVYAPKDYSYGELHWFSQHQTYEVTESPRVRMLKMEYVEPRVDFARVDQEPEPAFLGKLKTSTKTYINRDYMIVTTTKHPGEKDSLATVRFFDLHLWVSQKENEWIDKYQNLARLTIPLIRFYQKLGMINAEDLAKFVPKSGNWFETNPAKKF